MTTDPFTEAARAEANKLTEHWSGERNRRRFLSIFTSGAKWARTHLATQGWNPPETGSDQVE